MKTWFEFPEDTRFARSGRADILYTPIFFANQGISAKFCLDNEWSKVCDDHSQFDARVQLIGKASLGFLSIGGRPVSALDTQYALPSVGFKPIYTLTILELSRRVRLEEGTDNRTPFEFRLHTSTLADLQQIASSLKTVTADTASTMDVFKEVSPALIVSVQYALVGTLHYQGEKKSEHDSEIRLFVSLDESQVPAMTPSLVGNNPLANLSQTAYMHLGRSKTVVKGMRRRDSLPLIRRLSRSNSSTSVQRVNSSMEEDSYLVVEVKNTEPFCFRTRDEASAAKFRITLTYHSSSDAVSGNDTDDDDEPPPNITANTTSLMKSLTSLTLEPAHPQGEEPNNDLPDDFFHLRAKIFPLKKTKLTFGSWERRSLTSAAATTAQNMMQGIIQSPIASQLNDHYRLRRASTLPPDQSIITEEEPISHASRFNDNPTTLPSSSSSSSTITTTMQSLSQEAPTSGERDTTLPTTSTAPPNPTTIAPSPPPPPPVLTIPDPPKRWTTSADLWLTHPITSTLTPSFTTPYISHLYTVSITVTIQPDISSTSSPSKAKAFKTLKSSFAPTSSSKSTIEFTVPVSVRYDLGLVPSYEIDGSLPEYDFSLPGYEDAVGFNPGALESLARTDTDSNQQLMSSDNAVNSIAANAAAADSNDNGNRGHIPGLDGAENNAPIEEVAAYEARVTGSRNVHAVATVATVATAATPMYSTESDRHAWRYTNVQSNAGTDVDDDDVLDMLMRNSRIGENSRHARRVYGDHDGMNEEQ